MRRRASWGLIAVLLALGGMGSHAPLLAQDAPTPTPEVWARYGDWFAEAYPPEAAAQAVVTVRPGELAAACRAAKAGDVLMLEPGAMYRESCQLPTGVTLDGQGATISGADVVTDWRAEGGRWWTPWPHNWGRERNPWAGFCSGGVAHACGNEIAWRREIVVIDGAIVQPVTNLNAVGAGQFYVDEGADRLWIGADPTGAVMEVAMRDKGVAIERVAGVTVKNVAVRHVAGGVERGGVDVRYASNVTLENVTADGSSWLGVMVWESSNVTARGVTARGNGMGGMGALKATGLIVIGGTWTGNGWRGVWGNFREWATGNKFVAVHGGTFSDLVIEDNAVIGLWFDVDVRNVVVERVVIRRNQVTGLSIEISPGPVVIRDSIIDENQVEDNSWWVGGVQIVSSSAVTIENGRIVGNVPFAQVLAMNDSRGPNAGPVYLTNNHIAGAGELVAVRRFGSGSPPQVIQAGNSSEPVTPAPSRTPTTTPTVGPSPTPYPAGDGAGLAGDYGSAQRVDAGIDFAWGVGAPMAGMAADGFMVTWRGDLLAPVTGTYRLHTYSDDGTRLTVGGKVLWDRLAVDGWRQDNSATVELQAGQRVPVELTYREISGEAYVRFEWTLPSGTREVVPASQLYPAAIAPTNTPRPTVMPSRTPEAGATATPAPDSLVIKLSLDCVPRGDVWECKVVP